MNKVRTKDKNKKALVVVGICIFTIAAISLYNKRRQSQKPSNLRFPTNVMMEMRDNLSLSEVVGYFKDLNLDSKSETPIIVTDLAKVFPQTDLSKLNLDKGNTNLFFGVNSPLCTLEHCLIISAKQLDSHLQDVLGKAEDGIVVLQ